MTGLINKAIVQTVKQNNKTNQRNQMNQMSNKEEIFVTDGKNKYATYQAVLTQMGIENGENIGAFKCNEVIEANVRYFNEKKAQVESEHNVELSDDATFCTTVSGEWIQTPAHWMKESTNNNLDFESNKEEIFVTDGKNKYATYQAVLTQMGIENGENIGAFKCNEVMEANVRYFN